MTAAGEQDRPDPAITVIDPDVPSAARAYSCLLGGKDHYESDRKIVAALKEAFKDPEGAARTNRQWLIRVVRWLAASAGVRQFIDCGSGLPLDENVHQVAQRHDPAIKVVYSDNDPTVQAHGRALLEENGNTLFVGADLREPQRLLGNPAVRGLIDFEEPVALIQCFTLHHISDEPVPVRDIVAEYLDALPRGSFFALTHITYPPADQDPGGSGRATADEIKHRIRALGMDSGYWREYDEVLSLFEGLELVEPGLVRAAEWWPPGPVELNELDYVMYGGVARKP
ncbi:SAM-dependent methyltransferase [Saccharomonospora sp. NPDC006951]